LTDENGSNDEQQQTDRNCFFVGDLFGRPWIARCPSSKTLTPLATRWNHAGLKLSDEAFFNFASLSTLARCSTSKRQALAFLEAGVDM
jgi:hypothetical protein